MGPDATRREREARPIAVEAVGSCACVPSLTPVEDRVALLAQTLAAEDEPVAAVTHLLRLCRDEHTTLWEHHADLECRRRVADRLVEVRATLLEVERDHRIPLTARAAIAAVLTRNDGDLPVVVVAHALAEMLDERYGPTFSAWFRARSPYQPSVGDPIPLDAPDLREVTRLAPTSPPWRLANRLDETRRLRLAGAWATQFRVVFDYSYFDVLSDLVGTSTVIATCHPNQVLRELGLPRATGEPVFPIAPVDLGAQRAVIDATLSRALAAGAEIAVLPELCITEEIAGELEDWVRRPGGLRLLVAGSFHGHDHGGRCVNRAYAWVRGHPLPMSCDKHSPADRPAAEAITPAGWPELRVYVTVDGWHLSLAICRDLLNPQAIHALAEVGTNLLFAPSMSETLVPFGASVAQLVGSTQAVVAVANNPAEWIDPDGGPQQSPGRALFGHPGFPQQTRQLVAPDERPGVGLLDVGAGHLRWQPVEMPQRPAAAKHVVPSWVTVLGTTPLGRHDDPRARNALTLRAAAVLVLLIGSAQRTEVILTRRSADLTHYPGRLVFPGGAVDPIDSGPADTALREANEEIGLDPASVVVVGALPSFALTESGFVVTPVLAWTGAPRFVRGMNRAEVAEVHRIDLAVVGAHRRLVTKGGETSASSSFDDADLGPMTQTVLELVAARISGVTYDSM